MKLIHPLSLAMLLLLPMAPNSFARGGGGGGGHGGGGHAGRTYYYFSQTSVHGGGNSGAKCVRNSAAVGDTVTLPDGTLKAVALLHGTSGSCANPDYPILAVLEPASDFACPPALPANPDAGIELPDGWVPTKQTCKVAAKHFFFLARNQALHASVLVGNVAKNPGIDVAAYAARKRQAQMTDLIGGTASDLRKIEINGLPAWQTEVRGVAPVGKQDTVYSMTIIDNGRDIIYLNALIRADQYAGHKEEIDDLAYDLDGLDDNPAAAQTQGALPVPAPTQAQTQ